MKTTLGIVVGGSLSEGLTIRVGADVSLELLKAGKFVTIAHEHCTFFSMITDLKLEVTNPDIVLFPPDDRNSLLGQVVGRRGVYVSAQVKPMLMVNQFNQVGPVKTIPLHFSEVLQAQKEDVSLVFGDEADVSKRYFALGMPLDMNTPVCIDLERLTERSSAVFGKTGTGKTFLTRLVLAGLIKQNKGVALIFDMHGEYGIQARTEERGQTFVKGLKSLFADKIAVSSLDPAATRRRGGSPDVVIEIPYSEIQVEDILCLQHELNLHSTALEAAYLIVAQYKKEWLSTLLASGERLKEFAQEIGAHPESVAALYRKLKRIERLPFLKPTTEGFDSVVDHLMGYLARGVSVIIEFGNYNSTFCYLLIANIIARRVHEEYVAKTERFLGSQRVGDEPQKLLVVIEEAHKFLSPQAASQTIFGTIAREMRKYYVSLLVVDQRPSGIESEVLSQIGTKIIAQLNDEKDIAAVLTGVASANHLRGVLASLDSKKQVLLLGHAVAMPVVIQTREYDAAFYQSMVPAVLNTQQAQHVINELF